MQAQGVWDAVEPSNPKAAIEEKTDKIALDMIYQGIPEEILMSLTDKKSTKDAWEAIKTVSQGAERIRKARAQTLRAEFEALTIKDSDRIDDFYTKINGIVSNIRAFGEEISTHTWSNSCCELYEQNSCKLPPHLNKLVISTP